ncbi:iron donor protein CyaY [Celerinatantimonas diazotrophica]|uniref:Iron-sulfur cluster assembly protein CyaY n=1 Tax=Celerinatantimonas diazotrophica TaxID=412034 RepID=A0A4R1KH00_9GAMM|nr:iron donor protein CyaY [Celerinatantimonas diazotrophica]TCK63333.1 CyaY protein [Celerinatantimonas diazotrophica]CAG9298477.1 Iron-sulfur cluster assembly protein CyaY [Celerinatantimonas diazotrophica]
MTDSEFHQLADDFFERMEQALDEHPGDIDYEGEGGLLKLLFENGSHMVINKQEPLHQIWVATKSDGHHFEYQDNHWVDNRGGGELNEFIVKAIEQQSGERLILS